MTKRQCIDKLLQLWKTEYQKHPKRDLLRVLRTFRANNLREQALERVRQCAAAQNQMCEEQ